MVFEVDSRPGITAAELAHVLGVSVRTIYRDVSALQIAGVPIYGEVGRGGGLRVVEGYRSRSASLRSDEAGALLAGIVPQVADQLGYSEAVDRARRKVNAQHAKPGELPPQVGQILIDPVGWYRTPDPAPHLGLLAEAMRSHRLVTVRYRRWSEPNEVRRQIAPHGLVMKAGRWYVMTRSRQAQRTYRVDQIVSARISDRSFEPDPHFDLAAAWAEFVTSFRERLHVVEATVALDRRTRDQLRREDNPAIIEALDRSLGEEPDGNATRVVMLPFESIDHAAAELMRLGTGAEALTPWALRQRIATIAVGVAQRHQRKPPAAVTPQTVVASRRRASRES
jgi:predicted DNA-binding transcriptional regulator YafY